MSSTWRISIHKLSPGMAILGLLVLATSTHAQRPTTAPEPLRPPEEMRPDSLETRRFKMMEMERQVKEPISEEEQKLALTQIAQDYRELQIINNKMMSTSMPAPEPNFLSISRTLEEIRKRAARLKDNLRLADPQEKSDPSKYKPAQNTKEFKTHLLALDDSIMRLVKNPIFKEPDVVKLDEAAKARGELEFIIVTSQLIRKDADRLHKSADKTP
ncbi:MAG TPA: hypothetical protein VJU84_16555 [Pyrinomonadaceae bacterium]|nr:hypothetical protein [Pyrinomonadaceae bacterium]